MTIQLLFALLLVGVAEAQQDIYPDCLHMVPNGATYDICRSPDLRKILSEPNSSEKKTKKENELESWIWIDKGNGMIATCNETLTRCWTPCEVKMKEAMRLIRPYIDYGEGGTTTDLLYRSPQTKLREEADRLDKRDAAVRKWEAIYQECVK